jgi:hypothetical protein
VAACWTNGITSGYSANYYGGSDTVTTSQAALMLMKALGYFQYGSDFADDWQLATIKQGNKIDLFEDVDSGVRDAMTRNDLAQLVLNTLESGTVEASDDTIKVTTSDATVEAGSVSYNYIASTKDYAYAIKDERPASSTNSTTGYIVELGEKLYNGDLKKDDTVNDEFGRPSTQWTYNSTEIGTYADSVTSTWTGKVTEKALYTAVGTSAYDNYTWTIYRNGALVATDYTSSTSSSGTVTYTNTHAARAAAIPTSKTSSERVLFSGNGVLTQVFVDSDEKTVVLTMIDAGVAEVTKVADNGDDTYEVTVSFKTRVVDGTGTPITGVDTKYTTDEEFTKGDIVVYTASADSKEIESLALTSTVAGKVTAQKNADYTTLDGTTYSYNFAYTKANANNASDPSTGIGAGVYDLENSATEKNPTIDKDVTLYLDTYGYVVAFEGKAATAEDYLYVKEISNSWETSIQAKVVFYDGTTATVSIDNIDGKDATKSNVFKGRVYKYSEGTSSYDLETVTYDTVTGVSIKNDNPLVDTYKTDNDTVFVNVKDEKAYTGYSSVTSMTGVDAVMVLDSGVAEIVFVTNYSGITAADDDYVIMKGKGTEAVKIDGTTVYRATDAYDVNGEKITDLYFTSTSSITDKGLYRVTDRNGKDQVTSMTLLTAINGTYVAGKDAKVYATSAKNGVLVLNTGIDLDGSGTTKQTFAVNSSTSYVLVELNKKNDVDDLTTGNFGDIMSSSDANADMSNLTGVYVMTVGDASDAAPVAETVLIIQPYQ